MSWQDIILGVGSWVFLIALLPSVFSKNKPPLFTSVLTGTMLTLFTLVYLSLSLQAAALSTFLVALVWLTLAWQKYTGDRTKT